MIAHLFFVQILLLRHIKKKENTVSASIEYFDHKRNNLLSWLMFYFVNIARMW